MDKLIRTQGVAPVYLAAVIGITITVSLVFIAYDNVYEQAKEKSDSRAVIIKDNITRKINSINEAIYGMRTLFDASNKVDADEFRILSDNLLARHPYIESAIYLKKITSKQRKIFEEDMRDNGYINFSITEKDNNKFASSRVKDEYYAVVYKEPFTPLNAKYLGFDYLSSETFRKSIDRAIDSTEASTSYRMLDGKNTQIYAVFIAVYAGKSRPEAVAERRRTSVGVIALHIDATKLAESYSKYEITLDLNGLEDELGHTLLHYDFDQSIFKNNWVIEQLENLYRFSTMGETYRLHIRTPLLWNEFDKSLIGVSAFLGLLITWLIILQVKSIVNRNHELYRRNTSIIKLVQERTEELAIEKERALITLESIADAVITTDNQGCIDYLNPIAESITGWTREEALGLPVHEVFVVQNESTQMALDYRLIYKSIENAKVVKISEDVTVINKIDLHETSVEISTAPIKGAGSEINGAVVVSHDVSNARRLAQEMTYLATHDNLTELPNRVLLLDRLVQFISRGPWNQKYLAVLFLDLDRFKLVNDTYGHDVGDELLRHVANRLVSCLREGDTVSRLGGDEFVIILVDLASPSDVNKIAEKIIQVFNTPFQVVDKEFYTTASIGICIYPKDSDSALELMKKADIAMYRAKAAGKNNYVLYDAAMGKSDAGELSLETDLRRAVEREEFELYYQPQVDALSGTVVGVEALIRWDRPEHGLVSPLEFIPVAEETGLIIQIGRWVLDKAAEQCRQWQDLGLPRVSVSVNISAVQFQRGSVFNDVKNALKKAKLEPKYFGLELTEGTLAKDPQGAINVLNRLNEIGIKLSIDDFGTGYSSLSYLKQFCVSTLKVDRCFIKDLLTDPDDAAMCTAIISIAHNLNLHVIAEGVENNEQLEFLKNYNCHTIQGYIFSRPLSNDNIIRYLAEQKKNQVIPLKAKN